MDKIGKYKDVIIELLTKFPTLRDSDNRLVVNVWALKIGKDEIDRQTASWVMTEIANNNLPSFESISRCRRKIQEEIPGLRGTKYVARHKKKQVIINRAKWEAASAYARQNKMRFRVVSEDQLFHQGTRK